MRYNRINMMLYISYYITHTCRYTFPWDCVSMVFPSATYTRSKTKLKAKATLLLCVSGVLMIASHSLVS